MNSEQYRDPGLLLDTRSDEEKARDYSMEELVANYAPVEWRERETKDWRSFPIYDQGSSGSCVAQSMRKIISIYFKENTGFFPNLSASHIYQRRQNRPAEGMAGIDAFKIAQAGVTLEEFVPSHRMTDAQMDSAVVHPFMAEVGKTFAIGSYLTVRPDFETVASLIQKTKKGVMVWFYFTRKEWSAKPTVEDPSLNLYAPSTLRHSVVAVDAFLYNGKKYLLIEDSWGLDAAMQGRRLISEEFFKARCFFVGHFMQFKFEEPVKEILSKPFDTDLEIGVRSDEVRRLQEVLQMLGHFPNNVEATGYYGNVTATAVGSFQVKQGVAQKGDPGFGRFGPKTRAALNALIK